MSQIQRELESVANVDSIKTVLKLRGLHISINASYERKYVINPGTEDEQVLQTDYPNISEPLSIDAQSDEAWANFLNNQMTVHELVAMVQSKTEDKLRLIAKQQFVKI